MGGSASQVPTYPNTSCLLPPPFKESLDKIVDGYYMRSIKCHYTLRKLRVRPHEGGVHEIEEAHTDIAERELSDGAAPFYIYTTPASYDYLQHIATTSYWSRAPVA